MGSFKFSQLPKWVLLLPLPLSLSGCASKTYPQHELAEEILSARPGHEGKLTNQACLKYNFKGECTDWHVVEYDLADPNFQQQAERLNITCEIGKKHYKICKNEKDETGKPLIGFCRFSYTKNCFLIFCGQDTRHVDFFPIAPYQNVLNSGVRCTNQELYPEEAK